MSFLKQAKRLLDDQSGMTLIDLSIFLMVIGLLTAGLIQTYQVWKYAKAKSVAEDNIGGINKAISDFYYDNFVYPCPAIQNLTPNQAGFGVADCPGTFIAANNTYSGSVPFVTLKIPMEMSLDGWNNRLRYVVARPLTILPVPATPATTITVQRFLPRTLTLPRINCPGTMDLDRTNVHFILLSHGPKGIGAFTTGGTQVEACPTGGGAPRDAENCDGDATFFDSVCARGDQEGIGYYDDIFSADDSLPSRTWVYSTAANSDPTDIVTTISQVGINTMTPFGAAATAGVDVVGNVRSDGAIISDTLCDTDDANCFSPSLIAGPAYPQNDCAQTSGGVGMRGLWGGTETGDSRSGARARCQNSFLPATQRDCSPNYAIGFSGGKILCAP